MRRVQRIIDFQEQPARVPVFGPRAASVRFKGTARDAQSEWGIGFRTRLRGAFASCVYITRV